MHPAFKPLLEALPESLHGVILPHLEAMDTAAQQKLESVRAEIAPYKEFIDNNIDPVFMKQSVMLAHNLQQDPAGTVDKINKDWNLGFVSAQEAQAALDAHSSEPNEFDLDDSTDIANHPQFKAMQKAIEDMSGTLTKQQQADLEAQQLAEFEDYIDTLEEANKEGGFNRQVVTAFIASGMDGDAAVKAYREALTGSIQVPDNEQQELPPVVTMGGAGTVGSGLPEQAISFGGMKKDDLNETVTKMLEAAAQQNNQG